MAITLAGSAVFENISQPASGPTIPYTSAAGNTLVAVIIECAQQPLTGIASVTDSAANTWQVSTAASQNPPSAANTGGIFGGTSIFGNFVVTVGWVIAANPVTSITVKDPLPWSAATTATGTSTQFVVTTAAAAGITVGDIFQDLGPGQVLPSSYTVTSFGVPSGGNTPVDFTPAASAPIASGDTLSHGLNFWCVSVTEWAGIVAADTGAAASGTGTPAPSLTLTNAGDLVIGAAFYYVAAPPAGWTLLLPNLPYTGYGFPGVTGSYTPTWGTWGAQPYATAVMAFHP